MNEIDQIQESCNVVTDRLLFSNADVGDSSKSILCVYQEWLVFMFWDQLKVVTY